MKCSNMGIGWLPGFSGPWRRPVMVIARPVPNIRPPVCEPNKLGIVRTSLDAGCARIDRCGNMVCPDLKALSI